MNKHLFNDGLTHDTARNKVFFRHHKLRHPWVSAATDTLYIYYIYIIKRHKCQCPMQTGVSSVTGQNHLLSSVTAFPILGTTDRRALSSVLSLHLATL